MFQELLYNLAEALVPREQGYLGKVTFPPVSFFTITESSTFLSVELESPHMIPFWTTALHYADLKFLERAGGRKA